MRLICAADVRPGMLIDLQNDPYADPVGENALLEFELVEVCEVERETADCVAIGFESFDIVGFPPDHMLRDCTDDQ